MIKEIEKIEYCLSLSTNLGLEAFTPQLFHALMQLILRWILLRMPETGISGTIGQELLFYKVAFVVMGILVVLAIPQLRHEFGGRIT